MATFEINEKEYELKLTLKSVKYLNGLYQGGAFEMISHAMQGDIETFIHIIHACLFHTKENFPLKKIEAEVEKLIEKEEIDLDYIIKACNEVVVDSFFYKKTVNKLFAENKEAKKLLDMLTE